MNPNSTSALIPHPSHLNQSSIGAPNAAAAAASNRAPKTACVLVKTTSVTLLSSHLLCLFVPAPLRFLSVEWQTSIRLNGVSFVVLGPQTRSLLAARSASVCVGLLSMQAN